MIFKNTIHINVFLNVDLSSKWCFRTIPLDLRLGNHSPMQRYFNLSKEKHYV